MMSFFVPERHAVFGCNTGTDTQKLLVATMRRLTPAVMMMAINHKGRIIYANTQLANLLGFKLKALK